MQIRLLAPCRGNTFSMLASVVVIFVAMVLKDELERLSTCECLPHGRHLVYAFVV